MADTETELERAIASGSVNIPDGVSPEEEERLLRQAMSRPDDAKSTYVTGGDVSRFQRSSMPRQNRSSAPASAAVVAPITVAAPANTGNATPTYTGPSVRVTRGKDTQVVPVSKK